MQESLRTFFIGQGETRNILFKIKDENGVLLSTDKIMFAMQSTLCDRHIIKKDIKEVSELVLEDNTYKYLVTLGSDFTKELKPTDYLCDLTLIDNNGQKKTLTQIKNKPVPFIIQIVNTVGASS